RRHTRFHVTGVQTCALPIFQHEREERLAGHARREDLAAPPALLDLGDDRLGRRPAHETLMSLRASCSARYSSMLRLRNSELRPSSLCTKPTLETYGSMT